MIRHLAAAEPIIAPGRTRPTRVALLYSLSSDLWQPFGYLPMAERQLTYFSLIHDQYLVDMLTERDVEEGRLSDYDALYVTDPCVSVAACAAVRGWVRNGGSLYGSCVLANFTYEGIPQLEIRLPVERVPTRVTSLEKGPLKFTTERAPRTRPAQRHAMVVRCTVALGIDDVVLFE